MYVIGQTPGICDDRSILSYLPILAYKCIRHSKILDCLELLRTEETENFLKSYSELQMEPKLEPW